MLSAADRWLLPRAFVGLVCVDLGLRVLTFQRLLALLDRGRPAGRLEERSANLAKAQRYARSIDLAARHHRPRAQCLHRSLVLHAWLRRDGLPSELRIGVRRDGTALSAHAWVELDGEVVNDEAAWVARFAPLSQPGADPAVGGHARPLSPCQGSETVG